MLRTKGQMNTNKRFQTLITSEHRLFDLHLKETYQYRDLVFLFVKRDFTTKYRDLAMLVGFGLQLWQYASPVAYGLELIPASYRSVYLLNPITPIITTFRYAVFGTGFFSFLYYLISCGISLVIFLFGLILLSRIEQTCMDTI